MTSGAALFFLQFNIQPVCAVVRHFYPRKKAHQDQGDHKPYDFVPFSHLLKIGKGFEWKRGGRGSGGRGVWSARPPTADRRPVNLMALFYPIEISAKTNKYKE